MDLAQIFSDSLTKAQIWSRDMCDYICVHAGEVAVTQQEDDQYRMLCISWGNSAACTVGVSVTVSPPLCWVSGLPVWWGFWEPAWNKPCRFPASAKVEAGWPEEKSRTVLRNLFVIQGNEIYQTTATKHSCNTNSAIFALYQLNRRL